MTNSVNLPVDIWEKIFAINEDLVTFGKISKDFRKELNARVVECLKFLNSSLIERPNLLLEKTLREIKFENATFQDIGSLYNILNNIDIIEKKVFLRIETIKIGHKFDDLQRKLDDAFLTILPKMAESARLEMPKITDIKELRSWFDENLERMQNIFIINADSLGLEVFPREILFCKNLCEIWISRNAIRRLPEELFELPLHNGFSLDHFAKDKHKRGLKDLNTTFHKRQALYDGVTFRNDFDLPTRILSSRLTSDLQDAIAMASNGL